MVVQAIRDDDQKYLSSALFLAHLRYMGLSMDAGKDVMRAVLSGQFDIGALHPTSLDKPRKLTAAQQAYA